MFIARPNPLSFTIIQIIVVYDLPPYWIGRSEFWNCMEGASSFRTHKALTPSNKAFGTVANTMSWLRVLYYADIARDGAIVSASYTHWSQIIIRLIMSKACRLWQSIVWPWLMSRVYQYDNKLGDTYGAPRLFHLPCRRASKGVEQIMARNKTAVMSQGWF